MHSASPNLQVTLRQVNLSRGGAEGNQAFVKDMQDAPGMPAEISSGGGVLAELGEFPDQSCEQEIRYTSSRFGAFLLNFTSSCKP